MSLTGSVLASNSLIDDWNKRLVIVERLGQEGDVVAKYPGVILSSDLVLTWFVAQPLRIRTMDGNLHQVEIAPVLSQWPFTVLPVRSGENRGGVRVLDAGAEATELFTLAPREGQVRAVGIRVLPEVEQGALRQIEVEDGGVPGVVITDSQGALYGYCVPEGRDVWRLVPHDAMLRWSSDAYGDLLETSPREYAPVVRQYLDGLLPHEQCWDVIRGRFAEQASDLTGALEVWSRLATAHPDVEIYRSKKAEALFELQRYEEAMPIFENLAKGSPDDPQYFVYVAECRLRSRPNQAVDSYAEVLAKWPSDKLRARYAFACLAAEQYARANEIFSELYVAGTLPPFVRSVFIQTLRRVGNTKMAARLARELEADGPLTPGDAAEAADAYMDDRQFEACERMVDIVVNGPPADAQEWARVGSHYIFLARYEKAALAFREAGWLEPENPEHKADLALALAKNHEIDETALLAEEVLAKLPENPEATCALGIVFMERRNPDGAAECLERAISQKPLLLPIAAFELALVYFGLKRMEDVCRIGDALVEGPFATPGARSGAYFIYARALHDTGKHDAALEWVDRSLAINRKEPRAHGLRMSVLAALGRRSESFEELQIALRLCTKPDDRDQFEGPLDATSRPFKHATSTLARADIALHFGFLNRAREWVQQHLETHPDDAEAHELLGKVLEDLGEKRASIESFKRALELSPAGFGSFSSLATMLYLEDRDRESLFAMEEALSGAGKLVARAYRLLTDGEAEEAVATLERAIALGLPRLSDYRRSADLILEVSGNLQRGGEFYLHALANLEDYRAYAGLGRVLCQLDRWDEGEAAFRESLRLHPTYGHALYGMGMVAMERDRIEEAIECFGDASRQDPRDQKARYMYARALLRSRRDQDRQLAERLLVASLELPAYVPDTKRLLGMLHDDRGETAEALRFIKEALAEEPDNLYALERLGQMLRRDERYSEEAAIFEKLARSEETTFEWRFQYAAALVESGDYAAVEPIARDLLRENPTRAETNRTMAVVMEHLDMPGFLNHFEKALEYGPDDPVNAANLIGAYLRTGRYSDAAAVAVRIAGVSGRTRDFALVKEIHRRHGVPEDMAGIVDRILSENPQNVGALFVRAGLHAQSGDTRAALGAMWAAYRLAHEDRDLRVELFEMESNSGRPLTALFLALQWLRSSSADDPEHVFEWLVARGYEQLVRFEEALPHALRAAEPHPDYLQRWQLAAGIYHQLGNIDKAISMYERLSDEGNEFSDVFNLGQLYKQVGRFEDALRVLARAQQMMPGDWRPLFSRGLVLIALGRTDEALDVAKALDTREPRAAGELRRRIAASGNG